MAFDLALSILDFCLNKISLFYISSISRNIFDRNRDNRKFRSSVFFFFFLKSKRFRYFVESIFKCIMLLFPCQDISSSVISTYKLCTLNLIIELINAIYWDDYNFFFLCSLSSQDKSLIRFHLPSRCSILLSLFILFLSLSRRRWVRLS